MGHEKTDFGFVPTDLMPAQHICSDETAATPSRTQGRQAEGRSMRASDVVLWSKGPVSTVVPPPQSRLPILLDSPHSGSWYPSDFGYVVDRLALRRAEDTLVDQLFADAPISGATLISARFPRAYIDCNRARNDIDPQLLRETWPPDLPLQPQPSAKSALGKGLIWRLLDDGQRIYTSGLGVDEVLHRIRNYYDPYYGALTSHADDLHRSFGSLWHINCHSMPAVSDAFTTDRPGLVHADIVLGDRDGTTCDEAFVGFVEAFFADRGYRVARNDPYKGVNIVQTLGRPHEGRHSLQLELNRKLYLDEATLETHDGAAKLRFDLSKFTAKLAVYVRSSLGMPVATPY